MENISKKISWPSLCIIQHSNINYNNYTDLFTSIFKFSLSENFLYYAVVTLVSAVFLTMAYKNVATTKRSKYVLVHMRVYWRWY